MSDPYGFDGGWALRAPNCSKVDTGMKDCGGTTAEFHSCCRQTQACPSAYNPGCCPYQNATCNDDSQYSLLQTWPKCADPSWTLCDNLGYPFCCPKSYVCYRFVANNGSGCGAPGYRAEDGVTIVINTLIPADLGPGGSLAATQTIFVKGKETKPTSTKTSLLNPSASTILISPDNPGASQEPPKPVEGASATVNNSLGSGAIVGIVIGVLAIIALAALVLVLRRRRKPNHGSRQLDLSPSTEKQELESSADGRTRAPGRHELPSSGAHSENYSKANGNLGTANRYTDSPSKTLAVELDGTTRGELDGSTVGRR